jgi:hypothetical protein
MRYTFVQQLCADFQGKPSGLRPNLFRSLAGGVTELAVMVRRDVSVRVGRKATDTRQGDAQLLLQLLVASHLEVLHVLANR